MQNVRCTEICWFEKWLTFLGNLQLFFKFVSRAIDYCNFPWNVFIKIFSTIWVSTYYPFSLYLLYHSDAQKVNSLQQQPSVIAFTCDELHCDPDYWRVWGRTGMFIEHNCAMTQMICSKSKTTSILLWLDTSMGPSTSGLKAMELRSRIYCSFMDS